MHGLERTSLISGCQIRIKPHWIVRENTRALFASRQQRHHFLSVLGEHMLRRAGGWLNDAEFFILWDHDWTDNAHRPGIHLQAL